jgi:hypothetical protein
MLTVFDRWNRMNEVKNVDTWRDMNDRTLEATHPVILTGTSDHPAVSPFVTLTTLFVCGAYK